jgi:hypothetical protein
MGGREVTCCQRITLSWSDEAPKRDSVVRVTVRSYPDAAQ